MKLVLLHDLYYESENRVYLFWLYEMFVFHMKSAQNFRVKFVKR